MTCRLAPAHAAPTRQTNLTIQIHGENTPALPVTRKGQSGRLLRRPQQFTSGHYRGRLSHRRSQCV